VVLVVFIMFLFISKLIQLVKATVKYGLTD